MLYFLTKKKARTNDIVNAHAGATIALKSLGFNKAVSISSMKMQNGGDEPSDEIRAAIDALKATADTAKRAMCPSCA